MQKMDAEIALIIYCSFVLAYKFVRVGTTKIAV
jgi:hypothetical protein